MAKSFSILPNSDEIHAELEAEKRLKMEIASLNANEYFNRFKDSIERGMISNVNEYVNKLINEERLNDLINLAQESYVRMNEETNKWKASSIRNIITSIYINLEKNGKREDFESFNDLTQNIWI